MSNWTYVAIAFTIVWGSLAVYGLLLARRVAQASEVERVLRETPSPSPTKDVVAGSCDDRISP